MPPGFGKITGLREADSFARAVVFAMSQPEDADVNESLSRPTCQEF